MSRCENPNIIQTTIPIPIPIPITITNPRLLMTNASRFDLYSFWRTSATYRVRVAFNLKGVKPHERNVNLDAGEQRSDAFLKINPMGAIPALIDNEAGPGTVPITQSLAILEFLDETYPTPPLLPAVVRYFLTRGVISGWVSAASIAASERTRARPWAPAGNSAGFG